MAGYIGSGASVVSSGTERKKVFDITTNTTSLTGLNYTVGKVHVFHNGVRLVDGTDYTATNSTSITLTVAAVSGDQVVVVSYASYQVALSGIDDQSNAVAITIDSNENVMLNTTNTSLQLSSSDEGFTYANNFTTVSRDGGTTAYFNRLTSDGDIAVFRKDGTTVGGLSVFNSHIGLFQGGTRLEIDDGNDAMLFTNNSVGGLRDGTTDIGKTNARIKNVHAVNYYGDGSGLTGVGGSTTAGAVGTYAFLADTTAVSPGGTYAGSSLLWAGLAGVEGTSSNNLINTQGSPSGTWRAMGDSDFSGKSLYVTVFVRIS